MFTKETLTYVNRETRQYKTGFKAGQNYESVSIKVSSRPNTWVSGFGDATTRSWQVGDTVEMEIIEKPNPKDPGKVFTNFTIPKAEAKIPEMEKRISALEAAVFQKPTKAPGKDLDDLPDFKDLPY